MTDLSDLCCDIADAARVLSYDDHSTTGRFCGSHIGRCVPDHQDSIHRTARPLRARHEHPRVRFGPKSTVIAEHAVEVLPPTKLGKLFHRRLTTVIGGQTNPKPMVLFTFSTDIQAHIMSVLTL